MTKNVILSITIQIGNGKAELIKDCVSNFHSQGKMTKKGSSNKIDFCVKKQERNFP